MEKVTQLLQEPAFWVGTVLVGILVNIASVFLMKALDRGTFAWSRWARKRSEERAAEWSKLREIALTDRGLALIISKASRLRARSLVSLVMGFAAMGLALHMKSLGMDRVPQLLVGALAPLMVLSAQIQIIRSVTYDRVLRDLETQAEFPDAVR